MKKSIRLEVAIGLISIDLIAQVVDVPFKQASSVKYTLSDELKGTLDNLFAFVGITWSRKLPPKPKQIASR